jgi:nicotinamide-nucleotide amidase
MTAPTDVVLQELARAVGARLTDANQALVTAESCTGGWIAKACTDVAGSSRWFQGGIVAYADAAKTAMLGVPAAMIVEHGAVSEPVVRAMAAGALQGLGGSVAIAVSGVAGPDGGTPAKPVGTVWLAWAWLDTDGSCRIATAREQFAGGREDIRRWTVARALQRLLET